MNRINNTSGYAGVSWHKASRSWRAQAVGPDGRSRSLGYFDDPFSAALTRDRFIASYMPRNRRTLNNLAERRIAQTPVLVDRRRSASLISARHRLR